MNGSIPDLHRRWEEACRPVFNRFVSAKGHCRRTQEVLLQNICRKNAKTIFGRKHHFGRLQSVEDFRNAVPVHRYEDLHPFIERIRQGEVGVLTSEPVRRLHLSSGTSHASKLIPFTFGLRRAFQAAIQPWVWSLYADYPGLKKGTFYWVVSPAMSAPVSDNGPIPVGFEDDADYLDPVGRTIFPHISALKEPLDKEIDARLFYLKTWVALLGTENLAMISFWSPRFFLEMWQSLFTSLDNVMHLLHDSGHPERAKTLDKLFSSGWNAVGLGQKLWPKLELVSCWTEGWAALSLPILHRIFGEVPIQGKGLMATEGIVSFPFGKSARGSVLAIQSHFFEFELEPGQIYLADELLEGRDYQVLLTTQGGLYRYRLGDTVRVVGWEDDIPRIEFVSKGDSVVDLCGEKLHEAHVGRVLLSALQRLRRHPEVFFLAPWAQGQSIGYRLFIEKGTRENLSAICKEIDKGLSENFYYGHCRQLGQLSALDVFQMNQTSLKKYARFKKHKSRAATIKPIFLEKNVEWLKA